MPLLVRDHHRESGAERHPDPARERRRDARACEVQSVRLPQPIDVLHLVSAERRRYVWPQSPRRWLEGRRRLRAYPRRRRHDVNAYAPYPVVDERSRVVETATDCISDAFIERWK